MGEGMDEEAREGAVFGVDAGRTKSGVNVSNMVDATLKERLVSWTAM